MTSASIFAISGRAERVKVERGVARATAFGFELGTTPEHGIDPQQPGIYLAGDDAQRLHSLSQAVTSGSDIAWALRGGYGATRLGGFEGIDLSAATVLGFSDVTALLAQVHRAGGRALHGPVVTSFGDSDEASIRALHAAIAGGPRSWSLSGSSAAFEGSVVGGNLEVLSRLVGRPDAPHYKDRIVVLEDVGEPWYRCDRALTHLFSASDLLSAKALVFGSFEDCEPGTVERLTERCRALDITCLSDAPVGHGAANHCFIWGERAFYSEGVLQLCGDEA